MMIFKSYRKNLNVSSLMKHLADLTLDTMQSVSITLRWLASLSRWHQIKIHTKGNDQNVSQVHGGTSAVWVYGSVTHWSDEPRWVAFLMYHLYFLWIGLNRRHQRMICPERSLQLQVVYWCPWWLVTIVTFIMKTSQVDLTLAQVNLDLQWRPIACYKTGRWMLIHFLSLSRPS